MNYYRKSMDSTFTLKIHAILTAIAVCVLISRANADLIYDGTIYRTGGGAVGIPYNSANVETTVDHIYFTVNTSGTIEIDLLSWELDQPYTTPVVPTDLNGDGEIAYLDTYIYLFNDDGSLDAADYIASNDDDSSFSSHPDGSINHYDSYISEWLSAGDYILAVGTYELEIGQAIAGHNPESRGPATNLEPYPSVATVYDHGDYRVTFRGDVIPEPATILLLSLGSLALNRKRRA